MTDINTTIIDIDAAIADARNRGDVIAEREYEAIAVGFGQLSDTMDCLLQNVQRDSRVLSAAETQQRFFS